MKNEVEFDLSNDLNSLFDAEFGIFVDDSWTIKRDDKFLSFWQETRNLQFFFWVEQIQNVNSIISMYTCIILRSKCVFLDVIALIEAK